MTGATAARTSSRSRDLEVRVSVLLVSALALIHVAMGFYVEGFSSTVVDLVQPLLGIEGARFAVSLTAWAPLILVVLLWARDRRLAWVAAVVLVGFATLSYLRGVVLERVLEAGDQDSVLRFIDWSTWTLTVLLPLGAALGWGVARRRGTGWWPGLLVASVVAAAFRWLDLDPFDGNLRYAFAALVYHVVPAVLAGLACWWIEVRGTAA